MAFSYEIDLKTGSKGRRDPRPSEARARGTKCSCVGVYSAGWFCRGPPPTAPVSEICRVFRTRGRRFSPGLGPHIFWVPFSSLASQNALQFPQAPASTNRNPGSHLNWPPLLYYHLSRPRRRHHHPPYIKGWRGVRFRDMAASGTDAYVRGLKYGFL
jgi:hypothetical protein